jgi:hypothetical protein
MPIHICSCLSTVRGISLLLVRSRFILHLSWNSVLKNKNETARGNTLHLSAIRALGCAMVVADVRSRKNVHLSRQDLHLEQRSNV